METDIQKEVKRIVKEEIALHEAEKEIKEYEAFYFKVRANCIMHGNKPPIAPPNWPKEKRDFYERDPRAEYNNKPWWKKLF